jgi:hypothetical protein
MRNPLVGLIAGRQAPPFQLTLQTKDTPGGEKFGTFYANPPR